MSRRLYSKRICYICNPPREITAAGAAWVAHGRAHVRRREAVEYRMFVGTPDEYITFVDTVHFHPGDLRHTRELAKALAQAPMSLQANERACLRQDFGPWAAGTRLAQVYAELAARFEIDVAALPGSNPEEV